MKEDDQYGGGRSPRSVVVRSVQGLLGRSDNVRDSRPDYPAGVVAARPRRSRLATETRWPVCAYGELEDSRPPSRSSMVKVWGWGRRGEIGCWPRSLACPAGERSPTSPCSKRWRP